jgi:hypothetical protein
MLNKFMAKLTELFEKQLQAKTGWSRNQIMIAFTQAVNETLVWFLEQETPFPNPRMDDGGEQDV